MRKNFGPKTYLYPMPVLILGTYDENKVPNAMNAAWGGVYDYNKVTISLSDHKTTENFKVHDGLTIAFATPKTLIAADYVGIVSGEQVPDKVARAHLAYEDAPNVDAPLFTDFPISLECKIDSFENGTLIASIVNVSVDESVLDGKGNIDVNKLEFLSYESSSHAYMLVKGIVGHAFSDGKAYK